MSKPSQMHTKFFMFFGLIVSTQVFVYTKSACIIIHGTWAKNCAWYLPCGDFYESIKVCIQEVGVVDEIISFRWSGLLGDLAHEQAAQSLINIILEYDFVILVAHSHGATVGIISSMMLGQKNAHRKFLGKIKKFYALGVPVDPTRFVYPDMSVIDKFYNIFSFGDLVQTVHGTRDRCFAAHERITNIAITIAGQSPSHSHLHHAIIGKYLLKIPEFYIKNIAQSFAQYEDGKPCEISFFMDKDIVYIEQPQQNDLLDLDKRAFELARNAFFRSRKNELS